MNLIRYTLCTAALASSFAFAEPIDETRDIDADAVINIEIPNGTVTLTGWDRNQFHIAGELGENSDGYDLRETGSGIRFEENYDWPGGRRGCWGWNGCDDDENNQSVLDIQVPRNAVLHFEGTNVQISASDLHGNTEIELVNGDIIVRDMSGVVQLETVNGDIDATSLDGRLSLETVNGDIDDRDSQGTRVEYTTVNGGIMSNTRSPRIAADTVNGDIELLLGELDELELSTVGGRLELDATLNPDAQLDISSVGGRIDLTFPANTSARFNISTAVGGRITNQLSDDEPVRENRYVNSSELNFSLNGGNGDVHVSTVNGNVTLRSK